MDAESPRQGGFLAATVDELKLVVWPSRQQLFSESIAVILMVSLSAATIAAAGSTPPAAIPPESLSPGAAASKRQGEVDG